LFFITAKGIGNLLEIAVTKKQQIRISSEVKVWTSPSRGFKWHVLSACDFKLPSG